MPGREAKGVHFALELLIGQNRAVSGELDETPISCKDCKVVIIGGGDTGSDCVGIARRQGAESIVQLDIGPCPPLQEDKAATWPDWPRKLRTSSSHEEGCERLWGISTKEILVNDSGAVRGLHCVKVRLDPATKRLTQEPGSDFEIAADRVFWQWDSRIRPKNSWRPSAFNAMRGATPRRAPRRIFDRLNRLSQECLPAEIREAVNRLLSEP